ncbi:hypothetical protein [Microseira wollei]|nr:hypothetical protein [Microseira wollei]
MGNSASWLKLSASERLVRPVRYIMAGLLPLIKTLRVSPSPRPVRQS